MQRILKLAFVAMLAFGVFAVPSFANTVTYTTFSSFQGAVTGTTTANFDGDAAGTIINNGDVVDGITFSSNIQSFGYDANNNKVLNQFAIQTGFDSTSMANYLGTTDASTGSLIGNDSFTMTFGGPITALGLYILTGNPLNAGTLSLDIGIGTALNSDIAETTLDDGTVVYFLGITSTTPFTSATIGPAVLGSDPNSGPTWNVDDIISGTANGTPTPQVPEPGTLVLMATGLGALVRKMRKA